MTASVPIPGSSKLTTPLGLGTATLMREPSRRQQQRLFEAAFDAGYRYIDTAPSYGLGTAEGAVGQFLKGRRDDVTVATKFGLEVSTPGPLVRAVQRPARALLKRFPSLRGAATQAAGGALHQRADLSPETAEQSLARSLAAFGTDYVDVFLLHEVRPGDLRDGPFLDWLRQQRERGRVRAVGLATSSGAAAEILRVHHGRFDVTQTPSGMLAPTRDVLDGLDVALRVTHGAFSPALGVLRQRAEADTAWARGLDDAAGADVSRSAETLAPLLLAWSLNENRGGVVLVGSSSEAHLREAPRAVGAFPEVALERVATYLSETGVDHAATVDR